VTAAAAVIPIDDPTITAQEQENADLDDQLLAEMDTSFPQAVHVPQATQVDPSHGVQATQPATPTLTAATAAAAAEPAGQQQRKRGRPKGSKHRHMGGFEWYNCPGGVLNPSHHLSHQIIGPFYGSLTNLAAAQSNLTLI
jgi:hypothetical protein